MCPNVAGHNPHNDHPPQNKGPYNPLSLDGSPLLFFPSTFLHLVAQCASTPFKSFRPGSRFSAHPLCDPSLPPVLSAPRYSLDLTPSELEKKMLPKAAIVLIFLAIALSSPTVHAIPSRPPNQKSSSTLVRLHPHNRPTFFLLPIFAKATSSSAQPSSTSKGANNNNGVLLTHGFDPSCRTYPVSQGKGAGQGNQGNGNNGNQAGSCIPNGGDPQTSCSTLLSHRHRWSSTDLLFSSPGS